MTEVIYLFVLVSAGAVIVTIIISTLIDRFGIHSGNLWRPVLWKEKAVLCIVIAGLIALLGVLAIALVKSMEAL